MRQAALAMIVALWPVAALAGLTEQQIGGVAALPASGTPIPLNLTFKNADGQDLALADAIAGRPTLLLPVDYTCSQTCGPALSIAAGALSQTELSAGRDYSVIVVGIDAQDTIDDARRFTSGQIGGPGVSVLNGSAESIQHLLSSISYRFQRDTANDAIAHPAVFLTLTADGRVSRVLSSLALQPADLRLALIEAGRGKIGGIAGRVRLLCYGFDAVHGIYTPQITMLLRVGGGVTIVVVACCVGFLAWRTRRRGASA
jgi:protein SCO1